MFYVLFKYKNPFGQLKNHGDMHRKLYISPIFGLSKQQRLELNAVDECAVGRP